MTKYDKYMRTGKGESQGRYFRLTWDFDSDEDGKNKDSLNQIKGICGAKGLKRLIEDHVKEMIPVLLNEIKKGK